MNIEELGIGIDSSLFIKHKFSFQNIVFNKTKNSNFAALGSGPCGPPLNGPGQDQVTYSCP